MPSPVVQQILGSALASCPVQTRTEIATSSYDTFKIERIRSVYERIIRLSSVMAKTHADADLRFPALFSASGLAKIRLPRLDYNVLIGRDTTDLWYKQVSTREAVEAWLQLPFARERAAKQNKIYRKAAQKALGSRSSGLSWRIQEELTSPNVYPVFWTLTVDAQHEYVIEPRRDEFKLWVRHLKRRFGDLKYCCVVERGSEGRLHFHSLFIFKSAARFSDPNHLRPGDRAEIPELRGQWPYGLSNPVAVRYSPTDVYGRLGWRWPRERKTGAPEAVAIYMAKYLTKSTSEVNGCRSKMSRGFGLNRLSQMTIPQAMLILSGDPSNFINAHKWNKKPPLALLRKAAAKKLFAGSPRLPLPTMKLGSVAQAALTLAMAKSTPMNAGDSLNPSRGFKGEFDQFKTRMEPVRIGGII